MEKHGIVFMGTSAFAVPALKELVGAGWPVLAVVTPPDRPQGRGRTTLPPPVKIAAGELGLAVIQTKSVKDEAFLQTFRSLAPEMVIVASFGQILSKAILYDPPGGCLNIHPSLLPRYRGAAPLNWSIINGETTTGVTIMKMDEGIDSGDILLQEETPLGEDETFGALHDRLARMGAELLLKTLTFLQKGELHPQPQNHALATWAPPLGREIGLIHWEDDCRKIARLVRGLAPSPCAYTFLRRKKLKVFSATAEAGATAESPGTVVQKEGGALCIAAAGGVVCLGDVQLEGKKRMPVHDFLRGMAVLAGERMGET